MSEWRNKYCFSKIRTITYIYYFKTYVCYILIHCRQTRKFRASQLCPAYLDHPSCKIPRCNSANILEPVLTGFKSLKIDENAEIYSFQPNFLPLLMRISQIFLYFQTPRLLRITLIPIAAKSIHY